MKRVAFLINRTIKRYDNVMGEIEFRLKDDMECKFFTSRHAGHIENMASEAVREGFRYIIAVGGDGSVNEALNGVVRQFKSGSELSPESFDWEEIRNIRLGIYPGGSGNDFARHMGITANIKRLRELIRQDRVKPLDIGWTSFTGKQGGQIERFFINITDVGMGGTTVQHLEKHRIGFLGSNLNYMKAIISSFVTYEKSRMRWTTDTDSREGKIMSLVVANGKYFGSGLAVAPDAEVDDGKFSLVTLGDITIMDYLKNLRKIKACKKIDHPEVNYDSINRITIEPEQGRELPIDMDGDFVGYCPLTIRCIPSAISIIA